MVTLFRGETIIFVWFRTYYAGACLVSQVSGNARIEPVCMHVDLIKRFDASDATQTPA